MPSPFPGMDPYLEGYLWPDVHHRLATQISDQLMPHLRPRYVARIEIQVVTDESPEAEIVQSRAQQTPSYGTNGMAVATAPAISPATVSVPILEFEVRLATVEVRDTAHNQLVTSIEILSPVNKREPGLSKYREKLRQLRTAQVHFVEIDLLRRGTRIHSHKQIPESAYQIALTRALARQTNIWTVGLADELPVIPIPLRTPDADVALDLGEVFTAVYDRAAYDLSINYREDPPPPSLEKAEQVLVQNVLREVR